MTPSVRSLAGIALAAALLAACRPATPPQAPPSAPAAPAAPAAARPPPAEVPDRFRGLWNSNLEHCGTGLNDSALRIEAGRIGFYESGGPVTSVSLDGDSDITILATLTGEGETWDETVRFRLSPDGETLTALGSPAPLVRRRCPPEPAPEG